MQQRKMRRRDFVGGAAAAGLAARLGANAAADTSKILNYNPGMEYRRLGKSGLMVSAVSLGGHWKRVGVMMPGPFKGEGYSQADLENLKNPGFIGNRHDVVSRAIEVGMNYIDACAGPEVLAYSKVLQGRRDKMYLGYSWHVKESRYPAWRSGKRLVQGLDEGLKEAGLDYVDFWRISLPMERIDDLGELRAVESGAVEALDLARKQGKARVTGVSTHNRVWLKWMVEQYPDQIQAVLFPYTADSKELPEHSLFDSLKKHDVGVFGIKPFADNALFQGDGSPNHPRAGEDSRRARLAIRYILGNPIVTAAIPGLINIQQVDNMAQAVRERRKLDLNERTELRNATRGLWSRLRPGHEWLRDWEYV
jgi:aryl-alcohol dehydrogenase-like predicted oxidoreductase